MKRKYPVELKYLLNFETVTDFLKKVDELCLTNWYIYDMSIEERLKRVKNSPYFKNLSNLAHKMEINADNTEIISWLDTMNYMYYALNKDILKEIHDDIQILQEMVIPLTKKRADYVLFSHNKILIIEFSFNKWKKEYQYENKLMQVIGYKELLASLLPQHILIGTYTVLLNAEYDECGYDELEINSKYTGRPIMPNNDTQIELASFINKFFSNDIQLSAIEELEYSCGFLSGSLDRINADKKVNEDNLPLY